MKTFYLQYFHPASQRASVKYSLILATFSLVLSFSQQSCRNLDEATKPEEIENPDAIAKPHRPVTEIVHPPLSGRPDEQVITSAQRELWNYLEGFNRLPDSPTAIAKKMFATKGEAPEFVYLSTSDESVFGNIEGLQAHLENFPQRYPWVEKLVEKYGIKLETNQKLFADSTSQILQRYKQYTEGSIILTKRKTFVKQWLECLLVVDYVFARGSVQDRKDGFMLLNHVFYVPAYGCTRIEKLAELGHELEIPANHEIALALMDDFPEDVPIQLLWFPGMTFEECLAPDYLLNYSKWALRVIASDKWHAFRRMCRVNAGNHCVRNQLLAYTIYWYHCNPQGRPEKGWADVAVKRLFHRIFGKSVNQEYSKYTKLLNSAYPVQSNK
jgi:hypothetical protein